MNKKIKKILFSLEFTIFYFTTLTGLLGYHYSSYDTLSSKQYSTITAIKDSLNQSLIKHKRCDPIDSLNQVNRLASFDGITTLLDFSLKIFRKESITESKLDSIDTILSDTEWFVSGEIARIRSLKNSNYETDCQYSLHDDMIMLNTQQKVIRFTNKLKSDFVKNPQVPYSVLDSLGSLIIEFNSNFKASFENQNIKLNNSKLDVEETSKANESDNDILDYLEDKSEFHLNSFICIGILIIFSIYCYFSFKDI